VNEKHNTDDNPTYFLSSKSSY